MDGGIFSASVKEQNHFCLAKHRCSRQTFQGVQCRQKPFYSLIAPLVLSLEVNSQRKSVPMSRTPKWSEQQRVFKIKAFRANCTLSFSDSVRHSQTHLNPHHCYFSLSRGAHTYLLFLYKHLFSYICFNKIIPPLLESYACTTHTSSERLLTIAKFPLRGFACVW